MGSNFNNNLNQDCFRELKNDFHRLVKNFKKNYGKIKKCSNYNKNKINNELKWCVIGGFLTLLIISQVGVPITFLVAIIILITPLWKRW